MTDYRNFILIFQVIFKIYIKYYSSIEIALMRQASENSILNSKMIVTDDEWLPFRSNQFDGAISCLNSHWIENLKGNVQRNHAN